MASCTVHRRPARLSRAASYCVTKDALIVYHFHFMFIDTWLNVDCRTSACVERMVVDPVRGCVQVAYAKGNIYHYTHVSRRAILNLLKPSMSLGFWVNNNLLPFDCKTRCLGDCIPLVHSRPQRCLSLSEFSSLARCKAWLQPCVCSRTHLFVHTLHSHGRTQYIATNCAWWLVIIIELLMFRHHRHLDFG